MKIEKIKISYSTTIPIMSYGVNDKIGVEMELTPDVSSGENEQFNLEELIQEHKANVDAIVKKLYPNKFFQPIEAVNEDPYNRWYDGSKTLRQDFPSQQQSSVEERRIGDIEGDMRNCRERGMLEMVYYPIIDKAKISEEEKRKLWLVYDEVYNKLSNKSK